jgi:hypothetical protein
MDTFTIKNIDETTGNVTVAFSVDNKDQVIANLPLDTKENLVLALTQYDVAYVQGLQAVTPTVGTAPSDVSSLIGASTVVDPTIIPVADAPVDPEPEVILPEVVVDTQTIS